MPILFQKKGPHREAKGPTTLPRPICVQSSGLVEGRFRVGVVVGREECGLLMCVLALSFRVWMGQILGIRIPD